MSGTHKYEKKNWRAGRGNSSNHIHKVRGFGLVEKMFWYYEMIKQEVNDIRGERGYYQAGHKEGGGSSNHAFVSDPTFQSATKQMEPIKRIVINSGTLNEDIVHNPELWLKVIEHTMEFFKKNDTNVYTIMKKRFFDNEPMAKTMIMNELSEGRYYRYRDEGITYARECAIQLGLIKVM